MRLIAFILCLSMLAVGSQPSPINDYKAAVIADVNAMAKQSQVMVDMVFSFGELGFQEVETSKYLTGVLKKEGFKIEQGIAGIPTAWIATWGSGHPVIALGSDVDCIPQASQKPGVAYHDPLIEGAVVPVPFGPVPPPSFWRTPASGTVRLQLARLSNAITRSSWAPSK